MIGSVIPASKGALTMLVSGDAGGFDRVRPELEKLASSIYFLEKPGLASKMKLINNHVLGGLMALLAEAVATAEDAGLSREKSLEILGSGAGNSMLLNAKKEKLLSQDFSPHFSSRLIHKDLHYLEDLAFDLKRPIYTAGMIRDLYGATFLRGEQDLDFSAIYRLFASEK